MDPTVLVCIVIPLIVLFLFIWLSGSARKAREEALRAAHDAYQGALAELRSAPTNPDIKQRALDLGRAYAGLTRQQKGTTVFDEMALSNDISAATAGATAAAPSSAPSTPSTPAASVADRLRQLDGLKADGLVSDAEYQERRAKILGDV